MVLTETVALLGVLAFAGASFFFALAETALFSLGKWQARQLAERSPRLGGTVLKLLEHPQDVLATMVLGNTFANAAMVAIALWVALRGDWSLVPTMLTLLAWILIGCEVLPKTLAVRQAEQWALRVAVPVSILQRVSQPLRVIAQTMNSTLLKAVVPQTVKPHAALTDEEYAELLELGLQQGALAASEKEIILQIITLDKRTVKEVMTPRGRMACISDDLSVEEMIEAARKFKRRRLPIYDETPDTIVGVLNTRVLLLNPSVDLEEAIEFPSFVPESMNLLQLLKSLQRQQRGTAVVLDEYGGTAGVVTLEDILEELVGDMRSEREAEGFVMERLAPGKWRVNATMRLDDFRREYPELGDVPEVETMGGLMTYLCGVVPAQGQTATFRGLQLSVQTADERRVRELLVEKTKAKGLAA
ncbi:MAG: hemolysin family protein [Verrucomicrobiota bacterium]